MSTKKTDTELKEKAAAAAEITETDAVTAAETVSEPETAAKADDTVLVYCGPSIKNVAKEGTVYAGGLPEIFTEYAKTRPEVMSLVVPLEKYAEFRAAIEQKGTAAYIIYKNVCLRTKEGK